MRSAAALIVPLLAAAAPAAPEGWLRTMEDGVAAAKGSGKPVLVVTAWTDGQ